MLPDGCVDIIWNGSRLFVAGPDTAPTRQATDGSLFVGVRFRPGMAPLFLGLPAHELRDRRVDLAVLWPDDAGLADALHGAVSLPQMASAMGRALVRRLPGVADPDPVVEHAARAWGGGATDLSTARLAELAAVSERQLHRRFLAAVGYGPKRLQRILRFQAFLASCGRPVPSEGGAGLAELAATVGYADQAHLTREARALAGRTPAQLRAARLSV